MFTPQDLKQIADHGLTPERVEEQVENFRRGFPFLKVVRAASPGDGVLVLDGAEVDAAVARYDAAVAGLRVVKFVPASGAATRMFKELFEFVNEGKRGKGIDVLLENIERFAFWPELRAVLPPEADDRATVDAIVNEGLNYGHKPKGLVTFHAYPDGARKAVEEHLVEGAAYAASNGVVRLHFTVSPEHMEAFRTLLAEKVPQYEARYGVRYDISFSVQKPSTDTIAVNPDNTPFIEDGHLLFRPGGHGALIQNLNDMESAVVFIKNIDNVVPDSRRADTIKYKEVLGGLLLEVHDQIEEDLIALDEKLYTPDDLKRMADYLRTVLNVHDSRLDNMADDEIVEYLKAKLNRPLRVCGMVRNEGEPGGGPFIAFNPDGSASPQILESNQVDLSNPDYKKMMSEATHFNPVDLVCYIKDIHGKKFDLPKYVDPATGFISSKSSHGKELRAMELPGLWNGAMSDWNTVFVEVPISTFNPVKTVNDLLRPAHQG